MRAARSVPTEGARPSRFQVDGRQLAVGVGSGSGMELVEAGGRSEEVSSGGRVVGSAVGMSVVEGSGTPGMEMTEGSGTPGIQLEYAGGLCVFEGSGTPGIHGGVDVDEGSRTPGIHGAIDEDEGAGTPGSQGVSAGRVYVVVTVTTDGYWHVSWCL